VSRHIFNGYLALIIAAETLIVIYDHPTRLSYVALTLCTVSLIAGLWLGRARRAPVTCTFCGGRGFFDEPTNFGDQPDGMQRITCPDCRGACLVRTPRGTP
jgi:hypothetical protein